MKLIRVDIANFRGIKRLSVPLDDFTVLIGENNAGKSSILDALQLCLSRSLTRRTGHFSEYDYHLPTEDSQPSESEPITITLYFKERQEDEWPDRVLQTFNEALQVDAVDGLNMITLRVKSHFDAETGDFVTDWEFLDGAGNPMVAAKNPRLVYLLQQAAPVFYLAALRDAAQEFRPRSQFWGPFVRNVKIEDGVRKELESSLSELNQKVLDAHTTFDGVRERLQETTKFVPLGTGSSAHIQALPGRLFDLLSKTQVMMTCCSGAKLPLYRHGEGTQSLAVMFLFDAFLRNRLSEDYDADTEPILALEEPESHLHPSAIRSLAVLLSELPGQKIIATHSGDFLAGIPLHSIRRLTREDGDVQLCRLGSNTLDAEDLARVTYHIRSQRGHLLFARCWLLIEGQTESRLLPEFARIRNCALDIHSVCCVEFTQFGSLDTILRLADDLGIAWHVLTDSDPAGKKYAKKAIAQLNGRPRNDHLTILPERNMEHYLWYRGYNHVYEQALTQNQVKAIGIQPGHPDYPAKIIEAAIVTKRKPALATEVAIEADKQGSSAVPTEIVNLINTVTRLAEDTTR